VISPIGGAVFSSIFIVNRRPVFCAISDCSA
jgi:hypothetical protein